MTQQILTQEAVSRFVAEVDSTPGGSSTATMLRFLTCGSVDDGKSTLIGRLLLETGSVYRDQLATLRVESDKHGTVEDEIDPALLLDGLEDERQQGITIDVAYRYFQSEKRKFVIADAPGHEQYTRNMVTAASLADAGIVLVDARKGILPQTKRHTYILSLMQVPDVIVAVNKMDLIGYDRSLFVKICDEYFRFAATLGFRSIRIIPVSGLKGDNVAARSIKMAWYEGATLVEMLETLQGRSKSVGGSFRLPIQRVVRPHLDFRGYAGTVSSGSIAVGDQVMVLPSRRRSRVKSIHFFDTELKSAADGEIVTVTLDDEIDAARGDVLVHSDDIVQCQKQFSAMLVWMSEKSLIPGKPYWLKQATKKTTAEVASIAYRVDIETLEKVSASKLEVNEIGMAEVLCYDPIVADDFRDQLETGAFILVDRVTHETVAGGMIYNRKSNDDGHWNDHPASQALQYHSSRIDLKSKEQRNGARAATLLITGLTGAGKTTTALLLEEMLFDDGRQVTVLDGENMRLGISRDLGFTAAERSENLRRAVEIASIINESGGICIGAFVAPEARVREKIRARLGDRLIHVHLKASIEVCCQRDRNGHYEAARRGLLKDFPGISATYEEPNDADLVIDTEESTAEEVARQIYGFIQNRIAI